MKIKNIMLVTLMLLAVLTIGAVSATDDVSLDNVTLTDGAASDELAVSDDEDIKANGDIYEEYEITVNEDEEICIDPDDADYDPESDYIADITVPDSATSGSFKILNGEVVVASIDVNFDDEDHWEEGYEDGTFEGTIYLKDFALDKVNDGNVLSFKFFDENGVAVESLTQKYSVILTDTTLLLTSDGGMTEEDVTVQVNDVDTTKPDEKFIYVNVTQKVGLFNIEVETDDEPIEIFYEDLSTTTRQYEEFEDEDGNTIYGFAFSLKDLNDYIVDNSEYNDLVDLIETLDISESEMNFNLKEEDETIITERIFSFTYSDGKISFVDEDEDEPVEVYYENLIVPMNEGWNETPLIDFTIKNGLRGNIIIYVNNNQTPSFNKTLTDLTPYDSDDECSYYEIIIQDLNILEAGKYEIHEYFVDYNGNKIHEYDIDEPLKLELYESQAIYINTESTVVTGEDVIIRINSTYCVDDFVLIYVDDIQEPIKINLNETVCAEENIYEISGKQLILEAGKYNLNVTYNGFSKVGEVDLISNVVIDFPEDNKTVYSTFNDPFVFISLEENEILMVDGKINVTIMDKDGNFKRSWEFKISDLDYDFDEEEYLIKIQKVEFGQDGNYTVLVRYFNGTELATKTQGNVNFKLSFDPEDYGASIKESVRDVDDYVITFKDIPHKDTIIVQIDGNKNKNFDSDEICNESDVYYISFAELDLADGTHSIRVYIDTDAGKYDLTSGNVYVDVVPNIDPALTLSANNITEGADAVIVITTNNTFSGVVDVKIANTTYNVNVTNGAGNISVSGLAAGTYNVTAIFKGDAFFNESTKNTTFVVNPKVATAISAPAVTTTYATSKNIVVTLKDANGNPLVEKEVTITLNGASKTLKTNAKGQVSYAIGSKLVPKTYTAALKFAGDSAYAASAGTVKVTVKKATPKIKAKKKTFKAKKKTKKYSVVLKTDKGKALKKAKVTLKVKGKKYTAKTNNKGKAVFKLKKLTKKGKYKAKVKFAGNKYYNKLTKKVKIKVKK